VKIAQADLLNTLPPEWPDDLLSTIQTQVAQTNRKLVVLDDDPTGTQTVYNVPVLTEWTQPSLEAVLREPEPIVYILTNSRSVSLAQAQAMNREIAASLKAASEAAGRDFVVVSRSDSTLRGHYPGEVDALIEALGEQIDATLIIPFFLEGGRLTIHDVHYVAEGDWLVPAGETEYARDATFGYRHSDLREWVSEKHGGRMAAEAVASITLDDIRTGGPDRVVTRLNTLSSGQICIVNAASYRDLEVLVTALLRVEASGKRFIYRTAASFVRVRGGLAPRPLLTRLHLPAPRNTGGLIIAGSYIQKSTRQIQAVMALPDMTSLEVNVESLLDETGRKGEIERIVGLAHKTLTTGQDVIIYTSRRLITGTDANESLQIGQAISSALVDIVRRLPVAPAWMIAKGGITSSDVATQGLQIRRAEVVGQAVAGVPIWRTGPDSRWPDLVYVVFPGNVGGDDAIADMVRILRASSSG
jgi:uncharacterized protein YgbK (DUF1537 family)